MTMTFDQVVCLVKEELNKVTKELQEFNPITLQDEEVESYLQGKEDALKKLLRQLTNDSTL